jgi:hypothetical protein
LSWSIELRLSCCGGETECWSNLMTGIVIVPAGDAIVFATDGAVYDQSTGLLIASCSKVVLMPSTMPIANEETAQHVHFLEHRRIRAAQKKRFGRCNPWHRSHRSARCRHRRPRPSPRLAVRRQSPVHSSLATKMHCRVTYLTRQRAVGELGSSRLHHCRGPRSDAT